MNFNFKWIVLIFACFLGGFVGLAPVRAATYYWDANSGTPNAQDGSGTWNTTSASWWTGEINEVFAATSTAVFGAGGTGGIISVDAVTAAGITFEAVSGGTYTLSGGTITLNAAGLNAANASGIVNSALTLGAAQTWSAGAGKSLTVGGTVNNGGKTLTVDGAGTTTLSNLVSGTGALLKNGNGTLIMTSTGNSFSGGTTITGGVLEIRNDSGQFELQNSGNSLLGTGSVTINGGTLRMKASTTVDMDFVNRIIAFGANGGVLDLASPTESGVHTTNALNVTTSAAAATPAIIQHNLIASTTGSQGWAVTEGDVDTHDITGAGVLVLQMTGGAVAHLSKKNGTTTDAGTQVVFRGVSGGDATAVSSSTNVGRFCVGSDSASADTLNVQGGLFTENAVQISTFRENRIIDSNITIRSGTAAFQGVSDTSGSGSYTNRSLVLATTVNGKTLTIESGAKAIMDSRFRDDANAQYTGGVTLNAKTVIMNGGVLEFSQSRAPVAGRLVDYTLVKGDIYGQGSSASDAIVALKLNGSTAVGTTTGGVSFDVNSKLVVQGSGNYGLRVEGNLGANGATDPLANLLTPVRIQGITGTGGTLTIAATDQTGGEKSMTLSTDPTATNNPVKLGLAATGATSNIIYNLGATANDLQNWAGLVVKGNSGTGAGTVTASLLANQSLTAGTSVTSLDLLGGILDVNDKNLTVEGGVNLAGGKYSLDIVSGSQYGWIAGGNGTSGIAIDLSLILDVHAAGYTPNVADKFFILRNLSTVGISGHFAGLDGEGAELLLGGRTWRIYYKADYDTLSFTGGNDVMIAYVPEPGTGALFFLGTLLLFRRRSRRRTG